jgi:hypothetical protein
MNQPKEDLRSTISNLIEHPVSGVRTFKSIDLIDLTWPKEDLLFDEFPRRMIRQKLFLIQQ